MNNSNLIEESKNKLIILLDEIINFKFFPPTQPENNIKLNLDAYVNYQMNNDEQNISQNRQNFIQQFQEDSEGEGQKILSNNSNDITIKDESINDKCCYCNINKSCNLFSRRQYCQQCVNILFNKMIDEGKNIDFDKVVTFKKEKDIFIYSLEILIKIILLKSNYILNNESIFSFNNQNNLKKLKYPMNKAWRFRYEFY